MVSTTENISQFYELCWFLRRILESPPEERLPNEDQWVGFDDSNNSLNAESFIYREIIPNLGSQIEMEGKVKNTWIQSITCSQFSVDNFSNFKVDKRSEVYNIYAFQSTYLIVFIVNSYYDRQRELQ